MILFTKPDTKISSNELVDTVVRWSRVTGKNSMAAELTHNVWSVFCIQWLLIWWATVVGTE